MAPAALGLVARARGSDLARVVVQAPLVQREAPLWLPGSPAMGWQAMM
jgi:hypothetical protein